MNITRITCLCALFLLINTQIVKAQKVTIEENVQLTEDGYNQVTIYTLRNNIAITAYSTSQELNTTTRSNTDQIYSDSFPLAELIYTYDGYSSTKKFNCHGYAWYMSLYENPLDNPIWLGDGQEGSPGFFDPEDNYLLDNSFIEVNEPIFPGIVRWLNADHSAVTTDTPGIIISKDNTGPLLRHPVNGGPHPYTLGNEEQAGIKYYIVHDYCNRYYPKGTYTISGPSNVYIKEGIFTINDLKEYDNVDWEYSSNFDSIGGTANSITLKVDCNSSYSRGWIKASILHAPGTYCDSLIELPKTYVYTGKPSISYFDVTFENAFDNPAYYLCKSHSGNYFEVDNKYDATSFDVQICNLNGQVIYQFTTNYNRKSINYTNLNGYYLFRIRGTNSCGTGDWLEFEIEYRDCSNPEMFFSPNPAETETTLTIDDGNSVESQGVSNDDKWSMEIYSMDGLLVYKKENLIGKEHTIKTDNMKKGVYIVVLKRNKQLIRKKLIIDK